MDEQPNSTALDILRAPLAARYRTPTVTPANGCFSFNVPNDLRIKAAIQELLDILQNSTVWDDSEGGLSADDTATLMSGVSSTLAAGDCGAGNMTEIFDGWVTLHEQYNTNVEPAYTTANVWQDRILNIQDYTVNLVPIYVGDGVWSFAEGSYLVEGIMMGYQSGRTIGRLYDITNGTQLCVSMPSSGTSGPPAHCYFRNIIYLPTNANIKLQMNAQSISKFGLARNLAGYVETYAKLTFHHLNAPIAP